MKNLQQLIDEKQHYMQLRKSLSQKYIEAWKNGLLTGSELDKLMIKLYDKRFLAEKIAKLVPTDHIDTEKKIELVMAGWNEESIEEADRLAREHIESDSWEELQ